MSDGRAGAAGFNVRAQLGRVWEEGGGYAVDLNFAVETCGAAP